MKIWGCKVGEIDMENLPKGSDAIMRAAVEEAYKKLTGEWPRFVFSGWGAELDRNERSVVENREPSAQDYLDHQNEAQLRLLLQQKEEELSRLRKLAFEAGGVYPPDNIDEGKGYG